MSKGGEIARTCPVCGAENGSLQVTCIRCGAFVQDRIASLNLFDTVWLLIESPSEGMRRILLAEQKNYSILLQMLFGIAYVSFCLWYVKIGTMLPDLQLVLAVTLVTGPALGIVAVTLLAAAVKGITGFSSAATSFRNFRAILSFASVPVIISVLFVHPVELGIFGLQLFADDPSPWKLQPVLYGLLLTIDGLLVIWSVVILYIGLRVAMNKRMAALTVCAVIIGLLLPVAVVSLILTGSV
jgi:hypothetical protein